MEETKKWKVLLLVTILVISKTFAKPKVIDKIAAIVNSDIILESEVDNFIKFVKQSTKEGNQVTKNPEFRCQVLKHLIMNKILFEMANESGIKISKKEIDSTIADISSQNKISLDQMKKYLMNHGIDFFTYRNLLCKEMLASKISEKEIGNRIIILPQEIEILAKRLNRQKNIHKKVNLSCIFIPLQKNSTFDQTKKIKELVNIITKKLATDSSNFSKLATLCYKKQKGLKVFEMKWNDLQELPTVFVNALDMAKKGDVIGPIRFGSGFYILKINDLFDQKNSIFITKMHVRHIFLKPSPIVTNEQIRINLNQIASDIRNGKISFTDAAKKFSEDLDSADQGGDLGWIEIDKYYDPIIRSALIKLRKGEMSVPVHSSLGWHLIELIDIAKVDGTYEMQKDQAYHILFNRKFSEEKEEWLREQHANAYIKILKTNETFSRSNYSRRTSRNWS